MVDPALLSVPLRTCFGAAPVRAPRGVPLVGVGMATFDLRVPAAQRNPSESTVSYLVSLELKDRSGKTRARHSLLRRFSAFEQLFEQLRSALSNIPDPPRKRSFAGVNFNAELIEERRTELESKLQELISDIRVLKHPVFVRWIELMRADDILFLTIEREDGHCASNALTRLVPLDERRAHLRPPESAAASEQCNAELAYDNDSVGHKAVLQAQNRGRAARVVNDLKRYTAEVRRKLQSAQQAVSDGEKQLSITCANSSTDNDLAERIRALVRARGGETDTENH